TFDTTNTVEIWKQIKEFYAKSGDGVELWIMMVAKTVTMAQMADKANNYAKKLIDDAGGSVTQLGIFRTPDGTYAPVYTEGMDPDVNAAVLKAHELANEFALNHQPLRVLIGARDFQGTASALRNFRTNTNNRVGVVFGETEAGKKTGAVGFILGYFASLPLQRKPSRRRNGDAGLEMGYITNGAKTTDFTTSWDAIHDKGYIFFIKVPNKSGFFFNGCPACCPETDDYSELTRGLVIDRAHRIAAITFDDELDDDIEVDENGFPSPAVLKSYQLRIETAITNDMIPENVSAVSCEIEPRQNLLSQGNLKIKKLGVRPKGYPTMIDVNLGFEVTNS
ncbi:MAG: hypothetical protein EAY68_10035, partial [Bacteroidetes bacterium]